MPIALRMLNKIEGLQQLVISLFKSLQVRPGLDLFLLCRAERST